MSGETIKENLGGYLEAMEEAAEQVDANFAVSFVGNLETGCSALAVYPPPDADEQPGKAELALFLSLAVRLREMGADPEKIVWAVKDVVETCEAFGHPDMIRGSEIVN